MDHFHAFFLLKGGGQNNLGRPFSIFPPHSYLGTQSLTALQSYLGGVYSKYVQKKAETQCNAGAFEEAAVSDDG